MKTPYKVVLINFGHPGETDKIINGSKLSKVLVGESRFQSCEIYKIPEIGERFMVVRNAFEDMIFKCLRIDNDKGLNGIAGYDYIIIASFVNRLAYETDENEVARLKEFTHE